MTEPKSKRTKTGRRPKYSRAEGVALVARWRSSGLSAQAFCERHNVRLNRLRYWAPIAERASARSGKPKPDFHVMTVPPAPAALSSEGTPDVTQSAKAVIVVVPTARLEESLRAIVGGIAS